MNELYFNIFQMTRFFHALWTCHKVELTTLETLSA